MKGVKGVKGVRVDSRFQVLTGTPPGEGYAWGMDSFLKLMISVRNPCYGAPPERDFFWRSPGWLTPYSKHISPKGSICHIVLDENVVKNVGICIFSVTSFEVDSSQKH